MLMGREPSVSGAFSFENVVKSASVLTESYLPEGWKCVNKFRLKASATNAVYKEVSTIQTNALRLLATVKY